MRNMKKFIAAAVAACYSMYLNAQLTVGTDLNEITQKTLDVKKVAINVIGSILSIVLGIGLFIAVKNVVSKKHEGPEYIIAFATGLILTIVGWYFVSR